MENEQQQQQDEKQQQQHPKEEDEQQQCVVMIPFPAQGHVNPMMRLACRIAKLGRGRIRCIFITSEWFASSAIAAAAAQAVAAGLIQVESIAAGAVPESDMKGNQSAVFKMCQEAVAMADPVSDVVGKLVSAGLRLRCILSDGYMAWPKDTADAFGVPWVALWTTSTPVATFFLLIQELYKRGYIPTQDALERMGNVPIKGLPALSKFKVGDGPFARFVMDEGFNLAVTISKTLAKADCILLNSFDGMEAEEIAAMQGLHPNCLPVGPLLPNHIIEQDQVGDSRSSSRFGKLEEDRECIQWLDKQAYASVVYISFGSLANMSVSQLGELAMGIEASGVPFLWAMRPSLAEDEAGSGSAEVFVGFQERTRSRGLIVPWAPQLEVLTHPSLALFLTHCGWNSTSEAVWSGVPMLAWPFFADQNTNARFIVSHWRVGACVKDETLIRPGAPANREEIQAAILSAMNNATIRERVHALSNLARAATADGGSSHCNLQRFINSAECG